MEEPILLEQWWVNGWIATEVMRFYSSLIHGVCIPRLLWNREPDLEMILGMGLAQEIAHGSIFADTRTKVFRFLPDLAFSYISWLRNARSTCIDWTDTSPGGSYMGNNIK